MPSAVHLHVYDLSMGMARNLSGAILGKQIGAFRPQQLQLCAFGRCQSRLRSGGYLVPVRLEFSFSLLRGYWRCELRTLRVSSLTAIHIPQMEYGTPALWSMG